MEPCGNATSHMQLLVAVFAGTNTLLAMWLSHRRRMADKRHKRFSDIMLRKHGISIGDFEDERRRGAESVED